VIAPDVTRESARLGAHRAKLVGCARVSEESDHAVARGPASKVPMMICSDGRAATARDPRGGSSPDQGRPRCLRVITTAGLRDRPSPGWVHRPAAYDPGYVAIQVYLGRPMLGRCSSPRSATIGRFTRPEKLAGVGAGLTPET